MKQLNDKSAIGGKMKIIEESVKLLNIDELFHEYLLGIEKRHTYQSNALKIAYDSAHHNNLDEIQTLKYCCIALQDIINEEINKRVYKELNK